MELLVTERLRQEALNQTSRLSVLKSRSINEAVSVYKEIRDLHDELTASLGAIKSALDVARTETLPAIFKDNGVTSISINGYRYTVSYSTRANVIAGKKEAAFQWLRENKLGEIIIETVNASTLSAQAKTMMTDGEELDPDLFNVFLQPGVSVTKV